MGCSHPYRDICTGVFFPVDQDAEVELRKLANHEINYVQLAVDTLNEAIKLEISKTLSSAEELKEVTYSTAFHRFSFFYFLLKGSFPPKCFSMSSRGQAS